METTKKGQINYLQWLRVFSAAAVVIAHTDGQLWLSTPWDTWQWRVLSFYDGLVRWPVLMFLMITGTIFLPRKTPLRQVLTRHIPRLIVAMLCWSAIYTFVAWYTGSQEDLLVKFINGHYHLWYLPFLWGIYLILPFLQKIATDDKLTWELLAVSSVVGLLIPWLSNAVALLWPVTAPVVRSLETNLNYTFFMDLLALLPLGYLLHKTDIPPHIRRVIYIVGILGAVTTGLGTIWSTEKMGTPSSVFCTNASPTVLSPGIALYVFAKYNLNSLPKVVDWIASHSFGIYLSHALVTEALQRMGIHVMAWNPVWAVPVLSVVIFAICLAISVLLSKIPVIGKYLT